MRRVLSPNQRLWVISTLLIALLVRALIPAGFMPATDRPFSFQICPDGFPAALLNDAVGDGRDYADATVAAILPGVDRGATAHAEQSAQPHAGHHHDGGALAHTSPHHDSGTLVHVGHHPGSDGPVAVAHQHGGPLHNHGAASAEHCVFAAAAGVFALAFAATFFAPAATIGAPDVEYLAPSFESFRFRISQPRGPPALS